MAVPVQDVLGGGPPEQDTPRSRPLALAITLAALLAAAVAGLVLRDSEPEVPVPVEVVGTVLFDDIRADRVELPSGDVEERDGVAIGSVQLVLPDRELAGNARFEYDASISTVDGQDYALHSWGDARLRFGANSCTGSFGWSNLDPPLEGGGALQVRCEDGATIVGRLVATPQPLQRTVVDLRDGWYLTGPAQE